MSDTNQPAYSKNFYFEIENEVDEMPIKIESDDITLQELINLFTYLDQLHIRYTLHIETMDTSDEN